MLAALRYEVIRCHHLGQLQPAVGSCLGFSPWVCACRPSAKPHQLSKKGGATPGGGRKLAAISLANREHNFGTVLAHGQVLEYQFALKNRSERLIRLLHGTALTPCCSSIGPLPSPVPPWGDVRIPAVIRPGYQAGFKRAEFQVETDDKDQTGFMLALQVNLVSAWEVTLQDGSVRSLALGRPGKQVLGLVARRQGAEGLELPERVSANSPLTAVFLGNGETKFGENGLTEAARDVEVGLPALRSTGSQRGEIRFVWRDGHRESHLVMWEVRSPLRLRPPGLVLNSSTGPLEREVTVESDGRPFRIKSVVPPFCSGKSPCLPNPLPGTKSRYVSTS